MSTGESDYAKRVVELSMQLANSRADVENLRMRIKAVDKEHEQLKKDRADMVDRIDAALRRAKADTWMEAAKVCNEWHKIDRTHIKTVADMAEELGRRFDARAARIDDGEST